MLGCGGEPESDWAIGWLSRGGGGLQGVHRIGEGHITSSLGL